MGILTQFDWHHYNSYEVESVKYKVESEVGRSAITNARASIDAPQSSKRLCDLCVPWYLSYHSEIALRRWRHAMTLGCAVTSVCPVRDIRSRKREVGRVK